MTFRMVLGRECNYFFCPMFWISGGVFFFNQNLTNSAVNPTSKPHYLLVRFLPGVYTTVNVEVSL